MYNENIIVTKTTRNICIDFPLAFPTHFLSTPNPYIVNNKTVKITPAEISNIWLKFNVAVIGGGEQSDVLHNYLLNIFCTIFNTPISNNNCAQPNTTGVPTEANRAQSMKNIKFLTENTSGNIS